jgi:hypothetical protein
MLYSYICYSYHHHHHQYINVPTARAQDFLTSYTRTGHNPPRWFSTGWWVLTTENATGANGLPFEAWKSSR